MTVQDTWRGRPINYKGKEKALEKTPTIAAAFKKTSETECLQTKVTRAESVLCGLVAELNLSMSVTEC